MQRSRLTLLPLLVIVMACAGSDHQPPCATLAGGGSYCLQASTVLDSFDLQQKVEASFRGRRQTIIAKIENDGDGLRLVGLTPFGQKLLQASYDNHAVVAAAVPDQRLNSTLLLALLQLVLWPGDAVRAGLAAPLTLEESAGQRRILNAGQPTLTITYRGEALTWQHIHLSIHAWDLELEIETVPEYPSANPQHAP